MNKKVRYEEMLPHEVVKARKAKSIGYLPIGTIEWHGEHNVLGLDTVKIHALAMRCAEKIGGLVFPPLFYGEPREHYLMEANHDADNKIKKKMALPPENFYSGYMDEVENDIDISYVKLLLHIIKEIRSLGFKMIIILAGHYPLLHHARAASEIFNLQSKRKAVAWAFTGYELIRHIIPHAGDHAAAWETSLMLALRPELVALGRLPRDLRKKLVGVSGRDPRKYASKEYGERGIKLIIEAVEKKIKELSHQTGEVKNE